MVNLTLDEITVPFIVISLFSVDSEPSFIRFLQVHLKDKQLSQLKWLKELVHIAPQGDGILIISSK